MAWCEANRMDYGFGLTRHERLRRAIMAGLIMATIERMRTGKPARRFKELTYATLDSWSRERRVIGQAEVTGGEGNSRFAIASLQPAESGARYLYEKIDCARGEMENRIKRTTLALDDELAAKAQAFTGLKETSSLVREALKALTERESARRLARLGGSEPTWRCRRGDGPPRLHPGRYVRLDRPSSHR
jgi:Arc/MetJ family transcription regulator